MIPKVSILIPVHNSARYLEKTLISALSQSWQNKEIIVVDDGSTDESVNIASKFKSDFLKVYEQANSGACKARNQAFEFSTGDYIQYLDADDLLSECKVEHQLKMLSGGTPTNLGSCRWTRFHENIGDLQKVEQGIFRDFQNPIDMLFEMWRNMEMMQTSVWLTPRTLIVKAGPWNEKLLINQDGEFFSRIIIKSSGILFSPDAIVYYRSGNSGSITRSPYSFEKASSLLESYQLYETSILAISDSPEIKIALAHNYYSFIYHFYESFPDLAAIAINKVNDWNIPPILTVGGAMFKTIGRVCGFYNTLKARKYLTAFKAS